MATIVPLSSFHLSYICQMGNNMKHMLKNNEQGFVSILSVIFFVLLMSVLTISFLRIMSDEQTQVVNDDLSKGALASAQSGVEDAKRALIYCNQQAGAARTACYQTLNNQDCPGMFDTSQPTNLPAALGLDTSIGDGSIRVGDPANNQRYTCVVTALQTSDVVGQASEGPGELIPLRSTGNFNQLRVRWQQMSVDGTLAIPKVADGNKSYRYSEWKDSVTNQRFVPMMRLQLVAFDKTQTITQMKDSTVGLFLTPYFTGYTMNAPNQIPLSSISLAGIGDKRAEVWCQPYQDYECAVTINMPADAPNDNKEYYLYVGSVYGSPHYKLELLNNEAVTQFDNVQPQVDSTGAAADVFRRVISRVSYSSDTFMTMNAIEAGQSLCKDFFVTDTSVTSPANCVP